MPTWVADDIPRRRHDATVYGKRIPSSQQKALADVGSGGQLYGGRRISGGTASGEGDDMTDEQFTAFCVVLAAVSVPSVSLLFAGAWELWRYSKRAEP